MPPRKGQKPSSAFRNSSNNSKKKGKALPANWPPELTYLTCPSYSPRLCPNLLSYLLDDPKPLEKPLPAKPPPLTNSPCPFVKIKKIEDPKHPAFTQYGLFAAKELPLGSFVLDYYGYVHPLEETDEKSDYDICLDREFGICIDAKWMGNEARFVNDYRGVPVNEGGKLVGRKLAGGPNVVFEERRVGSGTAGGSGTGQPGTGSGELRMGLWVGKKGKIRKGEELLVSYGKGFWKGRQKEEKGEEMLVQDEGNEEGGIP